MNEVDKKFEIHNALWIFLANIIYISEVKLYSQARTVCNVPFVWYRILRPWTHSQPQPVRGNVTVAFLFVSIKIIIEYDSA